MSVAEPIPPTLRPSSTGTLIHGLPVSEVLGASTLADARVIAGAAGLGRVVQRLNVMEVPDILAWVKPHELLLTTGYPLRNTPQSLGRLVVDLDERGLAALGVKLGRYLDALPEEMIEQADRLGFPLIQLPDDVGFDDILNQVLTDILNRQAAILARAEEVHRALVQIVLSGGGLREVTEEVGAALDLAVAVTGPDGRVIASSGAPADLAAMRAAPLFGEDGRLVAPPGSGGVLEAPGVAGAADPVRHGYAVVPVVAGGLDHGRFLAFCTSGTLRDTDVSILERAATVAALVVTKRLAVTAVESKYRADFLRDVLAGQAGSAEQVVAHGAGFDWDLDRPLAVVVAELDEPAGFRPRSEPDDVVGGGAEGGDDGPAEAGGPTAGAGETGDGGTGQADGGTGHGDGGTENGGDGGEPAEGGEPVPILVSPAEQRMVQDRLVAIWAAVARRRDRYAAVVGFSHEMVALVGGPDPVETVARIARDAAAVFADHPGPYRTFTAGVGRVAGSLADLPVAYDQAATAVRVGRQLYGAGGVAHFDRLGVYRLLSLVSDTTELTTFVRETLGELAGDADKENADLRRTLQVLLEANLNVAETARRLHFHYNTLRYRIGKLERLLGPFTEDAHLRLNLTVALHVLHMRGI